MQPATTYEHAGIDALFDFSFSKFITLSVVKVLYGLLIILGLLIYLVGLIGSFTSAGFTGLLIFLVVGTVGLVIQIILWRVALELVVVIFRIGENTGRLAGLTADAPVPAPVPA